jgi:RNA polymerase sigma-70 factor (ECF subfamily)
MSSDDTLDQAARLREAELVWRICAGDTAALGEFLQLKRFPLLAYIERRLGAALRRKIEPEDVLQETSSEAVRSLTAAPLGEGRDPFAWLCQQAERRIIDAHRHFVQAQKRSSTREVPLAASGDTSKMNVVDWLAASLTTPTQALSKREKEHQVSLAMEALSAEEREVVRLRYLEQLGSQEIAARIGKSDGAVRVMLTRTIRKLQSMVDQTSGETK